MFERKKERLFEVPTAAKAKTTNSNPFIAAAQSKAAETLSGNGAKKFSSSGSPFVDQFGKLGSYKVKRNFSDIVNDCELLWANSPKLAVVFIFYIRMITRVINLTTFKTSTSQKGAELRYEGIMRMMWLHNKSPKTFYKNLWLFPLVGSWRDIFLMLQYDLMYHGWDKKVLDWDSIGKFIFSGLQNENVSGLVKKYLPQIKARSKCTTIESQADTMIGKWICSKLNIGYKEYRKLKSSGNAHSWQQLISQQKYDLIDFDKIHGRALTLMVKGKFLYKHGLRAKYESWVTAPETSVKSTGFIHEIMSMCAKYHTIGNMPNHEQATCHKQAETLVSKAGDKVKTSFIVVRDTSGSMGSLATGTNMSCGNIAKSIALYFSALFDNLNSPFHNAWIEFNSDARLHIWQGSTFPEKWFNDRANFIGGTDFLSVIRLFIDMKNKGVAESAYPTGLLCISDQEFNPASLEQTNVERALQMLRTAGFSEEYCNNFVIVLWNLQSNAYGRGTGEKFETFGNVRNVFYFSGYSAAAISFLTEGITNAEELFLKAMDQEVLNLIEL